jgi:WD40 repeat protein
MLLSAQERIMAHSRPGRARPFVGLFRFRLRTLLLAAPLAGVFLGTVGLRWHRDWRTSQAEAAVAALEGIITRNEQQQIVQVELRGRHITDEALRRLIPDLIYLPSLRVLVLGGTEVSDEGVADLAPLVQLEELTIVDSRATDAGLARLSQARPDLKIMKTEPNLKAVGLAMRPVFDHAVIAVSFSPDGSTLVSGSGDGVLRFWRPEQRDDPFGGRTSFAVQSHRDWVFAITFRPDGKLLATGGGDDVIRLWDPATKRLVGELIGHEDDVHAIDFSPDGRRLYSTGDDATVRAWGIESRGELWRAEGHADTVPALAVHPRGTMLATGSRDHEIRLWSAAGEPLTVLRGHRGDVMSLAFSPDGGSLLSASYDKTLRIWNVATGRTTRILKGPDDWVFAAAWSPDGALVAGGAGDGLRWWDAASGRMLFHTRRQENVSHLAFRGDGLVLASASAQGDVRLWNIRGRYEKAIFQAPLIPAAPALLARGAQ